MQRCWDEDPLGKKKKQTNKQNKHKTKQNTNKTNNQTNTVRPSFGEIIHVLEGMKDENDLLASSPRKSMLSINDSPMAVGIVTRGSGMEEHIFTPTMPNSNSAKKAGVGSVSNFKPLSTNNSQNSMKGMINPALPVGISLQNSGKY